MESKELQLTSIPTLKPALPFINGGISGMTATTIIQPIDMVKVRLQLVGNESRGIARPTALSITRDFVSQGRVLELYTGLSAGLVRQAVYTTARLGFFDTFINMLAKRAEDRGTAVTFAERATAGLVAGGVGAFIGNPADLALVRMQADGLKPIAQRNNFKSVLDAVSSIVRAEGIAALWAGAMPTVARAMSLNLGQLAIFSEAKSQLKAQTNWSITTQTLTASAVAGFGASLIGIPFDFVKTRLQRQQPGLNGKLPYASMLDCFRKVAQEEGWTRFYRGFGTFYLRIAPHAMITLLMADYLGWLTK